MTVYVPPPVPGDPAGMRALAQTLRSVGDRFAALASSVGGAVHALTFEGPAATSFRGRVGDRTSLVTQAAAALLDLADLLVRSAAQVEAAQRERERLIRLRADEQRREARAATP